MDNTARRKLTIKMVFGIAIPLLIMVVTMVMVGASFAWFSDAKEVTISTITMETAQSYTIDFNLGDSDLWANIEYAGQTAIDKDSGFILSKTNSLNNSVKESNRAFSFVNVISLDTLDKSVDFTLNLNKAVIRKRDKDGNLASQPTRDYADDPQDISYAFTWFFKEHVTGTVTNYTTTKAENGSDIKNYLPVDPAELLKSNTDKSLYTPYGKLTFGNDGYVEKVNGKTTISDSDGNVIDADSFSVLNVEQKIAGFNTKNNGNKLFDFYIVFAPEKLFWSQYFKGDVAVKDKDGTITEYKDKKLSEMYNEDEISLITAGIWVNQMYYSAMDYLGSNFTFGALIDVLKLDETEGA